jgi:hypothetical protein
VKSPGSLIHGMSLPCARGFVSRAGAMLGTQEEASRSIANRRGLGILPQAEQSLKGSTSRQPTPFGDRMTRERLRPA